MWSIAHPGVDFLALSEARTGGGAVVLMVLLLMLKMMMINPHASFSEEAWKWDRYVRCSVNSHAAHNSIPSTPRAEIASSE
ncbi:unnamed protein product [Lampetra fluviatilis]